MKSEIFGSANWEQTDMESIFKGFEKSSKAKIEVSVKQILKFLTSPAAAGPK